jgi:leucyl-tRNA synthetase
VESLTLASEVFATVAAGRPARKVIVVPGRLVNVVI